MKKNTNVVTLLSYYTIFADLDHHRDPLEEVDDRVGLSWGWLQSPAKVAEKVHGVWAHRTAGFHCDWLELVGSVQMGVLLGFLSLCMLHDPTRFLGGCLTVGITKGVHAGGVPHQEPPIWPGNHGHPIRVVSISSVQACRFQSAGNVCWCQWTMDDIV